MRTLSAGDTMCARTAYPPVRAVHDFARYAGDLPGPPPRRAALVAADTVSDVMARWAQMSGSRGPGLRGGWFTTSGDVRRSWSLHDVRWVADVGVEGHVKLFVPSGAVHAVVRLTGPALPPWRIDLRWNANAEGGLAVALVRVGVGGQPVRLRIPAP